MKRGREKRIFYAMVRRVYIDNSVIGGVFDDEFSVHSTRLFEEFDRGIYVPVISVLTLEEIEGAPIDVINFFNRIKQGIELITISEDVLFLSNEYIREGRLSKKLRLDAMHIACASLNKVDIIASWNFKHIVNLDKIRIYNGVNLRLGLPMIEIRSPREIIHEEEI